MKYVMGLDLGISSIGWAVVNLDKNRIEDLGVRIFPAGERPKDGGALNENRRIFRGQRRRISRKRVRMRKIRELLTDSEIVSSAEMEDLYKITNNDIDVWKLRVEGLERKLTNREWARVLTTIAKRRGYKSNRKDGKDSNSDAGKVLKAISVNKALMTNKNYRTVGELIYKEALKNSNTNDRLTLRNKSDKYDNCVLREMLEDEVKVLFEKQKSFGNEYTSDELMNDYLEIFNYQKPFMTRALMEKMIGKCTLEPDQPRASKNSWTFERFMLLQKVNNLSWSNGNEKVFLSNEQRQEIIYLAYSQKEIKYEKLRKILDLPIEARFTGLDYFVRLKKDEYEKINKENLPDDEKNKKIENQIIEKVESASFVKLNGYYTLKSVFKKYNKLDLFDTLCSDIKLYDDVAEILSKAKTDGELRRELKYLNLNEEMINMLVEENITFDKYGHLSYKAMQKILPYLEEGKLYNEACEMAGYNFKADDAKPQKKLPKIEQEHGINPVMYRAVTQTRKVINAIIDKYGSPYEVHVEVARELSKNREERNKIDKIRKENENKNNEDIKYIKETFGIENPKPVDIMKVRLWREQGGKSAYSLKTIEPNELFGDNYVQIDHALPFSRSFDDSYNNKVLVLTKENQDKRNMTPREYISNDEDWERFEAWVKATYKYNSTKREKLLTKDFSEQKASDWRERNLVDTKFISRFVANYLKKNLLLENFGENENRIKVKVIPGAITTALRHYWGVKAKNRETDTHHAEDAVILACATNKFINKVQNFSKTKELYCVNKNGEYVDTSTGEIVKDKYINHELSRPWENFKEELEARMSNNPKYDIENGSFTNYYDFDIENLKPIFVSRMPNRKANGEAHAQTIYSERNNGIIVIKKKLNSISKSDIEAVISDKRYADLYMSDKSTYDAIYNRLLEFDFKADKAFASDFVLRKKSKNGNGPIVNSIKIPDYMNSGVKVQNGIAANGGMVRVDVFEKKDKFYLVPIYVADLLKDELPNKAIKANKPKEEWPTIDGSYKFKFALHSRDLIAIKAKNDDLQLYYYLGTDSATGAISMIKHDASEEARKGVQNLEVFEKYEVDLLGNYHKVKKETRRGGKKKSD